MLEDIFADSCRTGVQITQNIGVTPFLVCLPSLISAINRGAIKGYTVNNKEDTVQNRQGFKAA